MVVCWRLQETEAVSDGDGWIRSRRMESGEVSDLYLNGLRSIV
jgi:hypothetical protein